jgi:hypothetical protein
VARKFPRPRRVKLTCPRCHQLQNRVQGINIARPQPGRSFLVCLNCGGLNFLDAVGTLRVPAAAEEFRLWMSDAGPVVARALAIAAQVRDSNQEGTHDGA